MIRAGIAISITALLVSLYVLAFDWQPVNVPLDLATDNTATATFASRSDDTFRVNVQLERHLPFDDVAAIQTSLLDHAPAARHGAPLPTIRCSVEEDGHALAFGGYRGRRYGGESMAATLGTFQGREGHVYTIRAVIRGGDSRWQVTDPHLTATVWRDPVFFGLNNLQAAFALVGYAFLLGALLLAIGLWRARKPKQKTERWTFVE